MDYFKSARNILPKRKRKGTNLFFGGVTGKLNISNFDATLITGLLLGANVGS